MAERPNKLIIESPQIFAQTILADIVPRKPAADLKQAPANPPATGVPGDSQWMGGAGPGF